MKYFTPLVKQFQALSMRERLWAIAALVGVVYFIFEFALLRPQQSTARALGTQIEQQQVELDAVTKALRVLEDPGKVDPLARQRAERDELRNTAAQGDAVIAHASVDVNLLQLIRATTTSKPGLTLVSLKTLPVDIFLRVGAAPAVGMADMKTAGAAPAPALYKHGIEVTVQGSYPALVAYMQELERNAKGVFWGNVRLETLAYPDATLKMTIHTLSARQELPLG
ncbi:hypothetical protein [Ramlibacter sp. WS9]|uniref:hypothetical protein n=1 Tax=Ramlibacter sp. WS9 TaxID=1882741 RepID=UPI001144B7AF|nr:hypothetical protein [Ramlibacter sp. WS9]ROZ68588.1 hypothetical protein EEB15_25230 [Ramlibacter sp. WS9]